LIRVKDQNAVASRRIRSSPIKVAVLGFGAIGSAVADALADGAIDGITLTGVITRGPSSAHHYRQLSLEQAIAECDVVVECAGIGAVAEHGPLIVGSGTDLLIASIGALAEVSLRERLLHGGPGRTYLTTGAIGGLDLLGAAALSGGLDSIVLTTTKKPRTLVQPWMPAHQVRELEESVQPVTVFGGNVFEAIRLFPKSLNVAVALAAVTGMWEELTVKMIADPHTALTHHEIAAEGRAGNYRFSVSNSPHERNPATSNLVPAAMLFGLKKLSQPSGTFL
jgi:aspartate dehydrogenase